MCSLLDVGSADPRILPDAQPENKSVLRSKIPLQRFFERQHRTEKKMFPRFPARVDNKTVLLFRFQTVGWENPLPFRSRSGREREGRYGGSRCRGHGQQTENQLFLHV